MTQRKNHYFEDEDIEAIDIIRKRYGLSTESDAVRLVADPEAIRITIAQRKVKQAKK